MRTDVAGATSGKQGVGQRVQRHVGIRMAGQLFAMRNPDAAEPDMVARLEGMHVIAVAGSHVGKTSRKPLLGHFISAPAAEAAGPALASMLIYLLMASVLAVRPAGLFPAKGG